MDDRIKVVYSWIGPKGPLWNTELPNVLSMAAAAENTHLESRYYNSDSTWVQMFSHSRDKFDMYPACSITVEDDRPFIIPYTLFWRVDFSLYFCGRTGLLEFAHVPWHLIRLVGMKNGYILIDHGVEAYMSDHQLNAMHGYFNGIHGLPLNKIIYMTGAVNAKEIYEDYCQRNGVPNEPSQRLTIVPYASSAYIFKRHLQLPADEPVYDEERLPEKLFLMWNRRFRQHRLEAVLHLEHLGLIDRSYVSFSKTHIERPTDTFLSYAENMGIVNPYRHLGLSEDTVARFDNKLPLVLDGENDITQMCEDEGHKSRTYYQNSLISIVTETNFSENEVALTEKSFKPFKEKHPFILIAGPGALKYLKSLGFKTFEEFWPETYDQGNVPPAERMIRLQEVFKIIASWDENQLRDFRRRVKPIVEHNFQVLKSLSVTTVLDDLDKMIRENIK